MCIVNVNDYGYIDNESNVRDGCEECGQSATGYTIYIAKIIFCIILFEENLFQ
jgi:hypothetical protein